MMGRRRAAHDRKAAFVVGIEGLERRDCPAVVSISGPATIDENGSAVTLVATLSEAQRAPVQVRYFVAGSATGGRDYRLSIGSGGLPAPSGSFTFQPGQTSVSIRLTPVNDAAREGDETFQFNLLSARGHSLGTRTVAGTIRDDDSYTASIVGSARVAAGTTGTYTLQLSAPATRTETWLVSTTSYTASSIPTAADPTTDFLPLTNLPLVFRPGETAKTFRVQTVASAANEQDQFFTINARSSSDIPPVQPWGVTIEGNARIPVPTVTVADESVYEGAAGRTPLTFTLALSNAVPTPVTITYATRDGTATTADTDYEAALGSVTIAPGATSATVVVNVIGDTRQESDETFSLLVTSATNATIARPAAVGTILDDESAYQIDLKFIDSPSGSVPAAIRQLAREAANRWQQVILGDLPNVPLSGGLAIDDFELTVQMGLLGGATNAPNGAIANATATAYRQGQYGLPYQGITGLDPFDVLDISTPALRQWVLDVITHELGHALGFGPGDDFFDRWVSGTGWTGPNAVREYTAISGTTQQSVPLETGGGAGTAGAHWAEDVFGDELMTGIAADVGVAMPLSRVTVGALQDMGYTVNYAAAEPYTLPAIRTASTVALVSGRLSPPARSLASRSPAFAALSVLALDDAMRSATAPRQRTFAGLARA